VDFKMLVCFILGCRTGMQVHFPSRHTAQRAKATDIVEESSAEVSSISNARLSGLALQLDDGTRKSHSMAENTQFVTGFFKGLGDRQSFGQLVTSLYFVYEEMEMAFDEVKDPKVRALDYPELRRLPALRQDMAFFHGPNWREKVKPSTATKKYVQQIAKVAADQPHLLIAHQYTRYLGDLFGGQMMGGMAVKSLGLQVGPGTEFYRFRSINDTKAFIEQWYSVLNKLDLTKDQKDQIVEEANLVFRINIEIFEELEGSPFAAAWQLLVSSLRDMFGSYST